MDTIDGLVVTAKRMEISFLKEDSSIGVYLIFIPPSAGGHNDLTFLTDTTAV
jgi:hypothetical protein